MRNDETHGALHCHSHRPNLGSSSCTGPENCVDCLRYTVEHRERELDSLRKIVDTKCSFCEGYNTLLMIRQKEIDTLREELKGKVEGRR